MSKNPSTDLARLSISLPSALLDQLDGMVAERGLSNRSQVLAELIRLAVADHRAGQSDAVLAGTITLVFDAESGRVRDAIARAQRQFVKEIISSQNVFLEEDKGMEVMLVQGPPSRLHQLCDALRKVRGVQQINLVTTTSLLPPLHAHAKAAPSSPRRQG